MKMEQTQCSEMSAHKIQKPGNYPDKSIQHSQHSESLKSRIHGVLLKISSTLLTGRIKHSNLYLNINYILASFTIKYKPQYNYS
jgi:hypothetical protein